MTTERTHFPVLILGSGPAGYTAAIYAARANLEPCLITGMEIGGQLMTTTEVDNWPGASQGIEGPALMMQLEEQAKRFHTVIKMDNVHTVDLSQRPFTVQTEMGETLTADTLIIATGATAQYLDLPSVAEYKGKGISACATCDGFFYRDKEVAVIGGGNAAVEEALYLSKIAKKVTLVHRRDTFRAEPILVDQLYQEIERHQVIELALQCRVDEVLGDGSKVTGLRLRQQDGQTRDITLDGVFMAIGHRPNTHLFEGQLELDHGYIVTAGTRTTAATATSVPGVFAAGDVQDQIYRQACTSAATGCMAALDAQRFLEAHKE